MQSPVMAPLLPSPTPDISGCGEARCEGGSEPWAGGQKCGGWLNSEAEEFRWVGTVLSWS